MQARDSTTLKILVLKLPLISALALTLQCNSTGQEEVQPISAHATPSLVEIVSQQPTPALENASTNTSRIIGQTASDFAPQGWHLLKADEGDLNGDKRPDAVAVFSKTAPQSRKYEDNQNEEDFEVQRILIVALRNEENQLHRAAESERALLCHRCGGMLDEPLVSININHGVIHLEQESLGTSDVSYKHTIRYQDGRWLVDGQVKTRDRRAGTAYMIRQERPILLSEFDVTQTSRARE